MDTAWLLDFVTLAEVNNFTRAAQIRHSSQAAFSRRIQALEAWVGAELIDRSVFPTRLTDEGSRFLEYALDISQRVSDLRADFSGRPSAWLSRIRIAAPHALATGFLPRQWQDWVRGLAALNGIINPANVHDAVTTFVSGNADLLVCFHNPQQPIHLDPEQYQRLTLGVQMLRPYMSTSLHKKVRWSFPGTVEQPIPHLAYSQGAYLGRMVNLMMERASKPPYLVPHAESDMADVLRELALSGHGVAWLPDCVAHSAERHGALMCVSSDPAWELSLAVMAYRDKHNPSPALQRLWRRLSSLYEVPA